MDLTTLSLADLNALRELIDKGAIATDCEYWTQEDRESLFYKGDNLKYEIAVEWTRRFAQMTLNQKTNIWQLPISYTI